MKINDGFTEIDIEEIESLLFRSKNSLLSISLTKNDPTFGANILFALNDERLHHDQLEGLYEDDHPQYLDQVRHLLLHNGLLEGGAKSLNSHTDVQIIDPQNGQFFKYNGYKWTNGTISHNEIQNLDADDHTQYLTTQRHENVDLHNYYDGVDDEIGNVPHDYLRKLQDVNVGNMQNGQVFVKQGEFFVPGDLPVFDVNHNHDNLYLRKDGSSLDADGKRITDVGEPILPTDAATKGMVDAFVWKNPVNDIVVEYPSNPSNGSRYAISQLAEDELIRGQIIERVNGAWVITDAKPGISFYSIQDKKVYYWNGTAFVISSGGSGGASAFVDLSDVTATDVKEADVFVVDSTGQLVNRNIFSLVTQNENLFLRVPLVQSSRVNHVVFSDGDKGTFTNGIKTDEYSRFDLANNKIANAIIDCGAYYG